MPVVIIILALAALTAGLLILEAKSRDRKKATPEPVPRGRDYFEWVEKQW